MIRMWLGVNRPLTMLWLIALGLLAGFSAREFTVLDEVLEDWSNPVLTDVRITLERRTADEAWIRMSGLRHRSDCVYRGIRTFSRLAGATILGSTAMQRMDVPETGSTQPVIGQPVSFGLWKVWPVTGATSLLVVAAYDCGERHVSFQLGEVKL